MSELAKHTVLGGSKTPHHSKIGMTPAAYGKQCLFKPRVSRTAVSRFQRLTRTDGATNDLP